MARAPRLERTHIGGSLEISRMGSGLWQLAGGHDEKVDIEAAARADANYVNRICRLDTGLDCFDMADHYGDAELVKGQHASMSSRNFTAFTKWRPSQNGITSFENAQAAVELALNRMGQKQTALLQYHIWDYSNPSYLHNMSYLRTMQQKGKIGLLGLTNTDSAHMELLIDSGFEIATNQISCSVVDRRLTRGRLASVCKRHGVGILAYGTLLGGYLSEKWLGLPEPRNPEDLNWSLRKYLRFIRAAGGWSAFQIVLETLAIVAKKHKVHIAAVAIRYVLDQPNVKAVIVGSRLSEDLEMYTVKNLAAFELELDIEDQALISNAQQNLTDIPGDCGDEYRRTPYLTATGDLSHHLHATEQNLELQDAIVHGARIEYSSGSKWEPIAGYCRAVRIRDTIRVSGTTANSPVPSLSVLGDSSGRSQTVAILDKISQAVQTLGGTMKDIVRTRVIVQNQRDVEEISRAHGWYMQCLGILPANTLIVAGIFGDEHLVEIEADAVVGGVGNAVHISP